MNDLRVCLQTPWLPALIPALVVLVPDRNTDWYWKAATRLTQLSLIAVILQMVWGVAQPQLFTLGIERTMLILILFLAVIILRFSRIYLLGEEGQSKYVRLLTLTAVSSSLVVVAPRLDVLVLAWMLGSFTMNGLLQHYPDRRAAQLAAHKKFVVSRLAELCLLVACILIHHTLGTLDLSQITARAARIGTFPSDLSIASILIVIAVLLKTAQMPLHGWLMQVMEAPTPVSALLHAGVVNLGGIVLLRLHVFLDKSVPAQVILVVVGGLTFFLAGIVALTRISIKVRLAWSTCAQMGFLMVECGLGLYPLALLHLVGHSLYKAHAFLTCGTTVHEYLATRERANVSRSPLTTILSQTLTVVISTVLVAFGYRILLTHTKPSGNDLAAVITVGVGLAPILYRGFAEVRSLTGALARYTFLLALYLCWHRLSALLIDDGSTRSLWLVGSFAALLFTLHLVQSIVQASPASERWASFRHRAFHGFYLDESFTRLIVALWPTRYRHHKPAQSPVAHLEKEYA